MATTTAGAIRDQAIALIAALTPQTNTADRFIAMPVSQVANFLEWAESAPDAAFRRFQVRTGGLDKPVEVSNTDVELHYVQLTVLVAYPKTSRTGPQGALDRDDAIEQDRIAIEHAIGLLGGANFSPPNPDAVYRGHTPTVDRSRAACDYLSIVQLMSYYLAS